MRAIYSILVGLFLFVAINLFAGTVLRFQKVDLTENSLYTLSDGTRAILSQLDEPILVRLFHSEAVTADIPVYDTYARRVRELLEEFEAAADGGIHLQYIDPEPFSEAEELAISAGVRGQLAGPGGEVLYMGLSLSNSVDDQEVMGVLDPRDESRLEYELAKRIHELSQDSRPKVAVITSLPMEGAPANPMGGPPSARWRILEVMEEFYEVAVLQAPDLTQGIAEDVDVLLLAHPKALSDTARYAIDQYAVGGGKVLAFVDPYCFFDMPPPGQQNMFSHQRTSQLDSLLAAWGVELTPGKVIGDRELGRPVRAGNNAIVNFPLWMELNGSSREGLFDGTDFVTSELSLVQVFCPGELVPVPDAKAEVTPILKTSSSGRAIDATSLQYTPNPIALAPNLAEEFRSGSYETLTLGVRISGPVSSAFPEGPPEGWTGTGDPLTAGAAFNAIVIGDADLLAEELWEGGRNAFGMPVANDNPSLVLNALDNLTGSNDLLSLRSRGVFRRPFEKKDELDRQARERYMAKEEELRTKAAELDREIGELLQGTPNEKGQIIVAAQEAQELRDKQQEQVEVKREQREVRYQLRKDIDALGFRLKAINIALVPALVILGGLAFHFTRRNRSNRS